MASFTKIPKAQAPMPTAGNRRAGRWVRTLEMIGPDEVGVIEGHHKPHYAQSGLAIAARGMGIAIRTWTVDGTVYVERKPEP